MFKHVIHSVMLAAVVLTFPHPATATAGLTDPVSLSGTLSAPSKHTPSWIAYGYLNRNKKTLGIRNPRKDLIVTEIRAIGSKGSQVIMQRRLFGTPVWGDGLSFEIDGQGVIRRISGRIHPNLEEKLFYRAMHPAVSSSEAVQKANEWLRSNNRPSTVTDARLFYLPTRPGNPLVYLAAAEDLSGGRPMIVIHALTGRVITEDI